MNTPLPIPTASAHTRPVRKRKRKECRKYRQSKETPKKQRNVSVSTAVTGTRHVDVAAPGGVVSQPTQPSTESIPSSVARVATITQAVLVTQSSQESFPNQLSPPNPSRLPIPSSLITPSSLPPFSLSLVHLSLVLPQRTLLAPKSHLPLRSTNWCMLLT
jgi:hypothetical protein